MTCARATALLLLLVAPAGAAACRRSATLDHRVPTRDRPLLSGTEIVLPSASGFFLIHYTTTGADATTSVYAAAVAAWADTAHAVFSSMGWLSPPSDGTAGGDSRYDFYLMGLGAGLTGYTQVEAPVPGGYPDDATSYIVLAIGMTTQEGSAAVAHHVNQACQYAYSAAELGAWMEQTAGWIEEAAFPSANEWALRTGAYLGNCHKYLFVSDGWTEHGALLWPKYLADSGGDADLIRRIWLRCAAVANNNVVSATQQELAASGRASIEAEFQVFTSWNYVCGARDDGLHYVEGDLITGSVPMTASHAAYPAAGQSGLAAPYALGCNYVEFGASGGAALLVALDGSDAHGPWGAGVIAVPSAGNATYGTFGVNPATGEGDTTVAGFSSLQRVILTVQNLRLAGGQQGQFSYAAQIIGSSPPTTPTELAASVVGDWIRLSWTPSTDPDGDLVGYHVYRGNKAFLPFGSMTRIASSINDQEPAPGVQWTDQNTLGADVVGDETTNYFWLVTAVDAANNESSPSGRAGEFDYLIPYPPRKGGLAVPSLRPHQAVHGPSPTKPGHSHDTSVATRSSP